MKRFVNSIHILLIQYWLNWSEIKTVACVLC